MDIFTRSAENVRTMWIILMSTFVEIATALGLDPEAAVGNLEAGENKLGKAVKVAFLWENP